MCRDNFDLLPAYRVNQIVLSGDNCAQGVMIQKRGGHAVSMIQAKREVVLAAGLRTPIIMQ